MGLKQRTSTMDEDQIQVIQDYGQRLGNLDFSSTLRVVIAEWIEFKRFRVVGMSELPRPDDAVSEPVIQVAEE